ncbi:uncharacterized protein LOC126908462 isoform X10 [Daktulosphaira vitifoliae]|uniref:uncharacterized protein LOC126908462 isoform X9 n=1 Tax=Daktulosphaira vitifoliae TaxID=58002 RepID=UPI0021AAC534|nr:uncharacterized protein LOC126908462 isoform X9 [Daktulosphaira vitifoliae]XP_050546522.1 uncharacterized protein LOC126908462 isoform X10 [Daktulosphaira vitifoliae]
MLLLRFLLFCLFLIYILEFCKAKNNYNIYKDALTNLFSNDGWKNLNDVQYVTFFGIGYFLKIALQNRVLFNNFDNKVRTATLVLGCSYVKDLKIFYFIFEHFSNHCGKLYDKQNHETLGYDCTKKLLKVIKKINSLLKIMQETIQALDTMHSYPWHKGKKYDLLFCRMFWNLQEKNEYLKKIRFSNNSLDTKNLLKYLNLFFNQNQRIIGERNEHCKYIPYDLNLMWQELNKEYNTKTNEGNKIYFFDYLSKKLDIQIKHIMVNKFIKLGFKFDISAQKIAVPTPKQLNSDVDNSSNYIITDEMTALMQTESNEDTILMSTNEESVPSENIRTPKIDIFQQGLNPDVSPEEILEPMDIDKKKNNLSTNEESVPPENIRTPKIDIFQQESRDKELEDPSENLNTPELIDFLKQGLNPDMSPEEILEPMDIDKKKITEYIFL